MEIGGGFDVFKWLLSKVNKARPQYVVRIHMIDGSIYGVYQHTLEQANDKARIMAQQINQWHSDMRDINCKGGNALVPCCSCLGGMSYFDASKIKCIRVRKV